MINKEMFNELIEFIVLFALGSLFIALIVGHWDNTWILLTQDLFQVFIMWLWFSVIKKKKA
jgi:hypothetical protein